MIEAIIKRIMAGGEIGFGEAHDLIRTAPVRELCHGADRLCRHVHGDVFDLCSIINSRAGRCSEDCKFCAQSVHYPTTVESYESIPVEEALDQARENDDHGVKRISLVTAGRSVGEASLNGFGRIYHEMGEQTDLLFCASMGLLTPEKARRLKTFGVIRYHCNLEACEEFFGTVCTTHTYRQKVETLQIAREAGMDLCSGGIVGMGESLEQRLQLAFELRDLHILSIPINILTPIAHTPFAHMTPLTTEEILKCIALFRLINPQAVVRLAGGRNSMGEDQYRCFRAGANGAIVGNYLTTAGNSLDEDLERIGGLGFSFR